MCESVTIKRIEDDDPDTSYLEQEGFADRLEQYRSGAFCFVGVYAEAVIRVGGVRQVIRSSGLWGIESDSDEEYFEEVGGEEVIELHTMLSELGITHIPMVDE